MSFSLQMKEISERHLHAVIIPRFEQEINEPIASLVRRTQKFADQILQNDRRYKELCGQYRFWTNEPIFVQKRPLQTLIRTIESFQQKRKNQKSEQKEFKKEFERALGKSSNEALDFREFFQFKVRDPLTTLTRDLPFIPKWVECFLDDEGDPICCCLLLCCIFGQECWHLEDQVEQLKVAAKRALKNC